MVRGLLIPLALAFSVLAGCTTPPVAVQTPTDAPEPSEPLPLEVLVNGTYRWFPQPTPSAQGVLDGVYKPVSQVAANPCIFQGSPYFNNKQLPVAAVDSPVAAGKLTVKLDWTDADYVGKTLVMAYQAPGHDSYDETDRIGRGASATVPIAKGNATDEAGGWDLWLCLNPDSQGVGDPAWQPGPFLGSVHAEATFLPGA